MTVRELLTFRGMAGQTQTAMARRLGLSMRAYQEIEAQDAETQISDRHLLLIERASLTLAVEQKSIDLALPSVRREALQLAAIFDGE